MKELIEFRIFKDNYEMLSKPNPAIFNGAIWVLQILDKDPLMAELKTLNDQFRKGGKYFYLTAHYIRTYTKRELEEAELVQFFAKSEFQPCGEECGTAYNDAAACPICGAHSPQMGPLKLKKGRIPKKDIATSIAGEVVFSERFVDAFRKRGLKGASFEKVLSGDNPTGYYQISSTGKNLEVASQTMVKSDLFNDFPEFTDHIWVDSTKVRRTSRIYYHCPRGHLLGGNLISEVYVKADSEALEADLILTNQLLGARMGLLRPYPIHLCSKEFRRMIIEEKFLGFGFQVSHIV